MDVDDATLLRELRRALDTVAGQGQDAQAEALRDVLTRLNATLDDVARAIGRVKQRHARELSGLAQRLSALADQRAEESETADAVDAWIRSFGRGAAE